MMYSIEKQAQFLFEATHTALDVSSSPDIRNSFRSIDISQMQQSLKDNFKDFKQATFERLNDEVVVCSMPIFIYIITYFAYQLFLFA